tara:strand:- start:197 stop:475 length:279 start_codon:yes stop_codon:yes gene_type:complete
MNTPKAEKPVKTAQEEAQSIRQSRELDAETDENEKRLKAMTRDKLGSKSLLSGGMAEAKAGERPTTDATAPKKMASTPIGGLLKGKKKAVAK